MSNPVLSTQGAAQKSLFNLRRRHPGLFKRESSFLSTVAMLEKFRYSASARRLVWNLFNEGLKGTIGNREGGSHGNSRNIEP